MANNRERKATTKIDSVREALKRLRAMQRVFRDHGARENSNHRFHDRGTDNGINVSIREIEEALSDGSSWAAKHGV